MNVETSDPQALRQAARAKRKAFTASPDGAFVRAMKSAMAEYHQMRAADVSREDACQGLEAVLRDAWPHVPSKFSPACDACADTGWRETLCWHEARCGRRRCHDLHPSTEHPYGVPCDCAAGDRMRAKVKTQEDAIAAVGRTQKAKKGFQRFGQGT